MSYSLCNYCRFEDIKRRAKRDGKKVYTIHSTSMTTLGGVSVYVLNKGEKPPKNDSEKDDSRKVAWFMELPNHCCC